MNSNINQSPLRVYSKIPKFWPPRSKTVNYDKLPPEEHYADGWRDVVQPQFNTETHKRDNTPIYDEVDDWVTYGTIAFTEQEIQNRVKSQKLGEMENIIQEKIKKDALEQFQAITDGTETLAYKSVYPFWEEGDKMEAGKKYQVFDGTEVKLFRCLENHVADISLYPTNTVTHFEEVTETVFTWAPDMQVLKFQLFEYNGKYYRAQEDHTTVVGQDPTKAKTLWVEEK